MSYTDSDLVDWLQDFLGIKGRKTTKEERSWLVDRGRTKREAQEGVVDRSIARKQAGRAPYSKTEHAVVQDDNFEYAYGQMLEDRGLKREKWKDGEWHLVCRDSRGRLAKEAVP